MTKDLEIGINEISPEDHDKIIGFMETMLEAVGQFTSGDRQEAYSFLVLFIANFCSVNDIAFDNFCAKLMEVESSMAAIKDKYHAED